MKTNPEIDAVVAGILRACDGPPQLTIYTPSGRLFMASKYRHFLRLYLNADDECRNFAIDLGDPPQAWHQPIAAVLQWADDKEVEDAEE